MNSEKIIPPFSSRVYYKAIFYVAEDSKILTHWLTFWIIRITSINWLRPVNDPTNHRRFRAFSRQTEQTLGRCLLRAQFRRNFNWVNTKHVSVYIYIYTLGPVSFVSRRRSKLIGRANLASRLLLNSFWNTDHDGKDRIINLITRLNYGESTMGEDPVNQEN